MPSPEKIKYAKKLHLKKYRQKYGQFLVEGIKVTSEFIHAGWSLDKLYVSSGVILPVTISENISIEEVNEKDLLRMSTHKTPPPVVGIVNMPKVKPPNNRKTSLLLEDLSDPGNMGTIIRIADWFGIEQIIATSNSTDFYSPKVVASSMGSLARVNVYHSNLENFLDHFNGSIYAGHLEGKPLNLVNHNNSPFALIMGSESHGLSQQLLNHPNIELVTIPKYGNAESLNVGVATGIILNTIVNG